MGQLFKRICPLKALNSISSSGDHLVKLRRANYCKLYRVGGWVYSYIFHIRRLGLFFWVQNSEFNFFFWVLRKMYIFGGYEDFVDIFGGSSQNWASLRVISMHFRVFFKDTVQNLDIFWGAQISNIFWVIEIPDIFWGER